MALFGSTNIQQVSSLQTIRAISRADATQFHKLHMQGNSLVTECSTTPTFKCSLLSDPTAHLTCMDIGPSGDLALSASSDKTVYLWEAATGQIRRTLEGHLGDVYTCSFFPSGLAALTGGADMQLKIWCLVTGVCAATLAPGAAGGLSHNGCLSDTEPGGHRSGIVDTGIIHRGRNIVAIDRLGWLRLWDVASQVCISGIPLVPNAGKRIRKLCPVLEEACCLAVKKKHQEGSLFPNPVDMEDQSTWYEALQTSSTKAVEMGTNDAVVAVGMGSSGAVQLYELGARTRGCVARFNLPHATGSVEACAFPHSVTEPPSNSETATHPSTVIQDTTTTAFLEYGLFAGGQNGDLAGWDLRQPKEPLFTLNGEKGAVVQLEAYEAGNCHQSYLIVGRSDGRVMLHAYDPTRDADTNRESGQLASYAETDPVWRRTLELTGINCEPVRGLHVQPKSGGEDLSVWTASMNGVFRHYDQLATGSAFS